MRSTETAQYHTTHKETKEKSSPTSFWEFTFFKDILSRIKPRRELISWQSGNYFNDIRSLPKENVSHFLPELKRRVKQDAFSFLKEYGAFQTVISYDNYSPFGIAEGYTTSTTVDRCINFAHCQELLGRPSERAWLDVDLQKALADWMRDDTIIPGSLCISFSPRGTVDEGYPGQDSKYYDCIYFSCRKEDGSNSFKQISSWDSNDQLIELQNILATKGKLNQVPIKHAQPPIEHQILSKYITLPPGSLSTAELMALVYRHQDSWTINPDEISPKIAEDLIESTLQNLSEAIAQEFEQLVETEFLTANSSTNLDQKLDNLIEIFRDAVKRWSHDSASNFNETNKKLVELSSPESIKTLIEAWKAQCRIKDGSPSPEDHQTLSSFQSLVSLPSSSPIHKAASLAHCIAGTPASISAKMMQVQGGVEIGGLRANLLTRNKLESLIGKERAKLWKPDTKCITCTDVGWVGECNMCYLCEINPERRNLPQSFLSSAEAKVMDSLSGEDKNKAAKLFKELSDLTLRKTVSPEQLLHGDFVNPEAAANEELGSIYDRLFFAHNSLGELEKIVAELSGSKSPSEHENSGKVFHLPKPQTAVTSLAA